MSSPDIPFEQTVIVGDQNPKKKTSELPSQFRISNDARNLPYSASAQPDEIEFACMFAHLENKDNSVAELAGISVPTRNILVVDLRAEEHCYLNSKAVAILSSPGTMIVNFLMHKVSKYISFKSYRESRNLPTELKVESVCPEEIYLSKLGVRYARIRVTDAELPSSEAVDDFLQILNNIESIKHIITTWLEIHCHGGNGRSSLFAAIFVLTGLQRIGRLAQDANLADVLAEHLDKISYEKLFPLARTSSLKSISSLVSMPSLESLNSLATIETDLTVGKKQDRQDFLEDFLSYVKDVDRGFSSGKSWSAWRVDLKKTDSSYRLTS